MFPFFSGRSIAHTATMTKGSWSISGTSSTQHHGHSTVTSGSSYASATGLGWTGLVATQTSGVNNYPRRTLLLPQDILYLQPTMTLNVSLDGGVVWFPFTFQSDPPSGLSVADYWRNDSDCFNLYAAANGTVYSVIVAYN